MTPSDREPTGQRIARARRRRGLSQAEEQVFARAMADWQEWEQATAGSRRLAIAADTELRRRHPYRKIEPLRSAEPASISGAERQTPQQSSGETARMSDLKVQQQAFRAAMNEHRQLVHGEDATRGNLGEATPATRTPRRDAILQPPKPQITPSAEILQVAAEHDIEPEAGN
jgi:hypothetical protein